VKKLALSVLCVSVFAGLSIAQEVPRFTYDFGAGFTTPVGNTGRHLDEAWNIQGGAGINFSQYFGTLLQLQYGTFGINGSTLNNLGFPDGTVRAFSATIDPIVHLHPQGPLDVYLIGGGGYYHRQQEFTRPSAASFVGFDPFFGFYRFLAPVNEVLETYSVNKPGVNIGAGLALGSKWRGKFFAEARYHRIFMGNNQHTDYVPVTFGYRW
jgi:opacity protein-like surface antigen